MTRDELLAELLVERQTNPWWITKPVEPVDDDLACARRRRQMATDFDALDGRGRRAQ